MKKKRKQIKTHRSSFAKRLKTSHMFPKIKISNVSMEKGVLFLYKVSKRKMALFLLLNFLIGVTILTYTNTMTPFFPHLISLTLNILITLSIGKEYVHTILFLDKEILKQYKTDNIELKKNYERFRKKAFQISNISLCIIVLAIFFWGIFSQNYIKFDIVGWYAIFVVSIVVSISVIGYVEYVWLLWFLYRVSKCSFIQYNKIIPAYTPFLVKIGTLTKHAKWCFFFEGFLYVFEYFILIPQGGITLSGLNMPNNISFLITWIIIFFVIILAFPIIILIQESLLLKIVKNLKNQRIEILSKQFNILSKKETNHFQEIYICSWLINSLIASPDYPVKIQRLGPAIISIATIFLHVASFLEQYPELKSFLINRFLECIS